MQNHNIILFDGVCNFCNYWVNFIIVRDKDDIFKFATLQSEFGKELLKKFELSKTHPSSLHFAETSFDTFILIEDENCYSKSTGVLKIAQKLNYPVKVLYYFIFIPKFLRDLIYSLFAKNRYKFFGKRDICRIPTENESKKFLY